MRQQIRDEVKQQWTSLWTQKIEDKCVAEDLARQNYELLFIERGTVIKATKDYKPPDIREIYELNEKLLGVPLSYPDPRVGGWRKFARKHLAQQARWRGDGNQSERAPADKKENGPRKKGGRGWLHTAYK